MEVEYYLPDEAKVHSSHTQKRFHLSRAAALSTALISSSGILQPKTADFIGGASLGSGTSPSTILALPCFQADVLLLSLSYCEPPLLQGSLLLTNYIPFQMK